MTDGDARAPGAGGYASVNGLDMYYEIHGTGRPLVLLHGAIAGTFVNVTSGTFPS